MQIIGKIIHNMALLACRKSGLNVYCNRTVKQSTRHEVNGCFVKSCTLSRGMANSDNYVRGIGFAFIPQ